MISLSFSLSPSKNINHLEVLIELTKADFDIIAVFESRLIKNNLLPNEVSLSRYSYEFCPTEANTGGTLIYIRNHLSNKTITDVKIYEFFELESTFTEIFGPKKTNTTIGCLYKHSIIKMMIMQ